MEIQIEPNKDKTEEILGNMAKATCCEVLHAMVLLFLVAIVYRRVLLLCCDEVTRSGGRFGWSVFDLRIRWIDNETRGEGTSMDHLDRSVK